MALTSRMPSGTPRPRHPFLALSLGAVAVMVLVVLVTRTGVDLLLVMAAIAGLFLFERFVSDWLADVLGPMAGPWLVGSVVLVFGAIALSGVAPRPLRDAVSNPLTSLVGRAERYGYTGTFVSGGATPVLSPAASGMDGGAGAPVSSAAGRSANRRSADARDASTTPTVELTVEPPTPRAGDAARIVVTVSSEAGLVRGEIAVDINRAEAGRLMSTDGTAAWTTRFPEGRFRLQARYLGGWGFPASRSTTVVVDVGGP